jgi:hypothetical protein
MIKHQSNARLLRLALGANGIFSLLTGGACLMAPSAIASLIFVASPSLFGLSSSTLVVELGLGLMGFGALVLWTASQPQLHRGRAKLITFMDAGWVLGSIGLLALTSDIWTPAGFAIVSIVAIAVALFALDQALGLVLLYQGVNEVEIERQGKRMTLTATGVTAASPQRVWQVMSHQEAYADVADNLSRVEIIAGTGPDYERRCFDNDGRSWNETCTLWDEGRAFAFRVHTEAPDYPYPIAQLSGEWSLSPVAGATQIRMRFKVTAKSGLLNSLLFRLMAAPFSTISDRLLVRWIAIMEGRASPARPELHLQGDGSSAQPA